MYKLFLRTLCIFPGSSKNMCVSVLSDDNYTFVGCYTLLCAGMFGKILFQTNTNTYYKLMHKMCYGVSTNIQFTRIASFQLAVLYVYLRILIYLFPILKYQGCIFSPKIKKIKLN